MQILKNDSVKLNPSTGKVLLGTYNFKRVQSVCEDAMNNHKMVGIVGEPGYGKSCALNFFRQTHDNVFMVTVRPSMKSKHFWAHIYQALPGINEHLNVYDHRGLNYIITRVSEHLKTFATSLLIIDEAGKFTTKMLEYIHELRDQTNNCTGIILAGPDYFRTNLLKWVRYQKIGMPEVWRRINYWEELLPPEKSEIKGFCKHFGIVDPNIVNRFTIECRDFGTLSNYIGEYLSGNLRQ